MLYVIAVPRFAAPVQEAIARFRARHEPERARLVAPHVTLVFGLRGCDPDSFARFCRRAVGAQARFSVAFDGPDLSFDPVEKVYKLALACTRGHDRILSLHSALYDGPHRSRLRSDLAFRPHMTVATNVRGEALRDIDLAALGRLPISGTIDAVEVVELTATGLRRVARLDLRDQARPSRDGAPGERSRS